MVKVFIDVGAMNGDSIKRLYETQPDAAKYKIWAFEPDPYWFNLLQQNLQANKINNVVSINAAASNTNDLAKFYCNTKKPIDDNTLMPGKITGNLDYENPTTVDCVDFCEWFKSHITDDCYVHLKINIEGGEYLLIEPMIEAGILANVDLLSCLLYTSPSPRD